MVSLESSTPSAPQSGPAQAGNEQVQNLDHAITGVGCRLAKCKDRTSLLLKVRMADIL